MLAPRMRLPAARPLGAVADRPAKRRAPRHRGAPGRRGIPLLLRRRAPRRGRAGPLGLSGDPAALDPEVHQPGARPGGGRARSARPIRPTASRIAAAPATSPPTCAIPRASMQVWSRFEGYPGDGVYLEFHKMRWPGGLKLWRVSGPDVDLGAKEPYDPPPALDRARGHADHFAGLLGGDRHGREPAPGRRDRRAVRHRAVRPLVVRGPGFPGRRLPRPARPARGAARHGLAAPRPASLARRHPDAGRLVGRQRRLLDVAQRPDRLDLGAALAARGAVLGRGPGGARRRSRPAFILAQAARELLLAQSSDWQFIISTGAAADYGERRFREHCSDTEELVDGAGGRLARGARSRDTAARRSWPSATRSSRTSLPAIAAALGGSRSLVLG